MSVEAVEAMFTNGHVRIPSEEETEDIVFEALFQQAKAAREECMKRNPEFAAQHPLDEGYGRSVAQRICALRRKENDHASQL